MILVEKFKTWFAAEDCDENGFCELLNELYDLEQEAELGQLVRRMPEIVKWPLTNQAALAYRQHMTEEFWHVIVTPNEDGMLKAYLCKETPEDAIRAALEPAL